MNRIYYQQKIYEILDEAICELKADEFDILLKRIEEMIEDYKG